jgi:hypothetical protein
VQQTNIISPKSGVRRLAQHLSQENRAEFHWMRQGAQTTQRRSDKAGLYTELRVFAFGGSPAFRRGRATLDFESILESSGAQNKYLPPRDVDGERLARPEIKADYAVVNDVGKTYPGVGQADLWRGSN